MEDCVRKLMRRILPVFFYIIGILGMLCYSLYDYGKYPVDAGSKSMEHYMFYDYYSHLFSPIICPLFVVFIGLVIYEAWIIVMAKSLGSGSPDSNGGLAVSKKNVILVLAVLFAVLNLGAIAVWVHDLLVYEKRIMSEVTIKEYELKRIYIRKAVYAVYILASVVPLILAIIIRFGKSNGRFVKVLTIILSVLASVCGALWLAKTDFGTLSSRKLAMTKIVPVNLAIVLVMLVLTIVVTVLKKNRVKFKWLYAVVLILAILNVSFVSFDYSENNENHLPMAAWAFIDYSESLMCSGSDAVRYYWYQNPLKRMKIFTEDNMLEEYKNYYDNSQITHTEVDGHIYVNDYL